MIKDARFEDGEENPMRLLARSEDDLVVISALLQDAITRIGDVSWVPRKRRLSVLFNRFRWEKTATSAADPKQNQRVRTVLMVNDVLRVRSAGLDPKRKDSVLALLSLRFEPGEDGSGKLLMTFSGNSELALDIECLEIEMLDATQPYHAVSGSRPKHPDT